MSIVQLKRDEYLELEKIGLGAFAPLNGFMTEAEFISVVDHMRLPKGDVFTLPIFLAVDETEINAIRDGGEIQLQFRGVDVGVMEPQSIYKCDKVVAAEKIFGTTDRNHPGIEHFLSAGEWFVGGPVQLRQRVSLEFSEYELTPAQTKEHFKSANWRRVVGFQTRNVPHRAHEYLQRVALEQMDGLFIQPLVGRKKKGDYTPSAIIAGYEALVSGFYPKDKVLLGVLSTSMRYAGPREAVFHAIVRRNYGCTSFIVGRDHAGVGNYYGKYEAHDLTRQFDGELGIEIMRLHGPYHCSECDGIVTEQTCPHEETNEDCVTHISGTDMRAMLVGGRTPEPHLMRAKIIEGLKGVPLFIEDNETDDA